MSFINSKNKIQKLWNDSKDISFSIEQQNKVKIEINTQLNSAKSIQQIFSSLKNFDVDWSYPTIEEATDGSIISSHINWEVVFSNLNLQYLPYFKPDIILKVGDGANLPEDSDTPYNDTYLYKNFVWDIKDLEGTTNKLATLMAGIFIRKPSDIVGISEGVYRTHGYLPNYQVKLLLKFVPFNVLD